MNSLNAWTETMSDFKNDLEQVTELISLPEVYLKISNLMDDPSSQVDDFARIIRLDPNLSVTVLKVVNSAFYGFAGQIDNISRAVNMMGIGQLNIIALSVSAISALDALEYPGDIVPLKSLWRSSLFSGVLCRQLAIQRGINKSERLFVIGLLHEIGHLVLYTKFSDLAKEAIQSANDSHINIQEAEQRLLGCHYGNIGAMLMEKWNLPQQFQLITSNQPTPQNAEEDKTETALLHIAHAYATNQFSYNGKSINEMIHPDAWDIAQITPEVVEDSLETALIISADMERVILR